MVGLKRSLRRKIFFLFIVIFVLASAILVVYAIGYTFDFSQRALAKVGGIFVKSKTPLLRVSLNNSFVKENSLISGGALLPDLKPGMYLVRLERTGFQSWSRAVTVAPGMVTEIRNILLVSNPLVAATSTPEEISRLSSSASPDNNYRLDSENNLVAITSKSAKKVASNVRYFVQKENFVYFVDGNGFLARLDINSNEIVTLGRPGFYIDEKVPLKFIASPDGDLLVLDSARGAYLLDRTATEISSLPNAGGIRNAYFDLESQKFLLAKENSLEVFWMADNQRQPFQKKGEREEILKINSTILDAGWYFGDNAHVLVRTPEGIFMTELDGRGGRNMTELVSGLTDKLTTLLDYPNTIFYKKGKNNLKIEL